MSEQQYHTESVGIVPATNDTLNQNTYRERILRNIFNLA